MADTKITGLAALTGANLAVGDLFAVVDISDTTMNASGTDKKITTAELLIGILALPLAGGTMTGPITSTIGTITANTPSLSATQTWNAVGTTFTGLFLNVTNTTSAAASRVFDFQVGGVSKFSLTTAGKADLTSTGVLLFGSSLGISASNGGTMVSIGNGTAGNLGVALYQNIIYITGRIADDDNLSFSLGTTPSGLNLGSARKVAWSSTTAHSGSLDTGISRSSAGVVEVNNGNAGTFRDLKLRDLIINGATNLLKTSAALTDNAAAAAGTLLNAPTAGNPTKWVRIDDNGTARFLPLW